MRISNFFRFLTYRGTRTFPFSLGNPLFTKLFFTFFFFNDNSNYFLMERRKFNKRSKGNGRKIIEFLFSQTNQFSFPNQSHFGFFDFI